MFMECAHCRQWNEIRRDGVCPSCWNNAFGLTQDEGNKTTVVLNRRSRMPSVCCVCGKETRKKAPVKGYYKTEVAAGDSHTGFNFFSGLVSGFLGLPFRIFKRSDGTGGTKLEDATFVIRVTRCQACSKKTVRPIASDHERGEMKLEVDKRFAEKFHEANPTSVQTHKSP